MSTNSSPTHYTDDAFVSDVNFKVGINQKMKVPDRITFSSDINGDSRGSWTGDNLDMNVPERILVAGQHQHVGTRAPPREIVFDNSIIPTEPYSYDLPRVATPPRTLTLDKYPFPGVDEYEDPYVEEDQLPVVKTAPKIRMNDVSFHLGNQFNDSSTHLYAGEGLTPAEEVIHLRRQMAKLNRRIMALELENINRLQKEKIVVGFGIAYFLLKVIIWMNRN
ncbi:transport and Golgi organization protein 11 [Diorhabda carinulata]|uniref:transport and Golgi organization protein 11 n=1 Tax=Diorhabda carinulata TaxID=1163345 RepID=UPI0025A17D1D|nr:transport and Golgi organization protein 11 [Diorhabda carinulata]